MRRFRLWAVVVALIVGIAWYLALAPSHTIIVYNTSGRCLSAVEVRLAGASEVVGHDLCDGEAVRLVLRGVGGPPYQVFADRDEQKVSLGECDDSQASFFAIGQIIEIKPQAVRCGYLGLHP